MDTFVRDHLPPTDQQPEFIFDLPELHYPEVLNAAGLLDRAIADPTSDAVLRATIERAIGYPPGAPPPAVREGGAT